MNSPVIESGAPIPRYHGKYDFGAIKVGHSHLFTGPVSAYGKVRTAACMFGKRLGLKFALRKTDLGLEIWRLK